MEWNERDVCNFCVTSLKGICLPYISSIPPSCKLECRAGPGGWTTVAGRQHHVRWWLTQLGWGSSSTKGGLVFQERASAGQTGLCSSHEAPSSSNPFLLSPSLLSTFPSAPTAGTKRGKWESRESSICKGPERKEAMLHLVHQKELGMAGGGGRKM